MLLLAVPAYHLLCRGLCFALPLWSALLFAAVIVPNVLGVSSRLQSFYVRTLLKTFEWTTFQMELRAKERNRQLHKPSTGIIFKSKPLPLHKEIQDLRGSAGPGCSGFDVADVLLFCRRGVESVVEDELTDCFSAQELASWNLLTRSVRRFPHTSLKLTLLWVSGLLIRYGVLLPLRLCIAVTGIILFLLLSALVGFLPNAELRSFFGEKLHWMGYCLCVQSLSAIITYHDRENLPKNGGICVANHTTPIDVIMLANDRCYSLVGQVHGGLLGMIQKAMTRSSPHLWFERAEVKDRHLVVKRLCDHAADKTKEPILIFPEGTCVNNTSVMMFKKGSFEISGTVYPVAIKYDARFGDVFWNSSEFGLLGSLLRIMSSWAIVCSVWYLPPMSRQEGEDAVEFANRVKAAIAAKGGLKDLPWDGGLKRTKVKDAYREKQQEQYGAFLRGDDAKRRDDTFPCGETSQQDQR